MIPSPDLPDLTKAGLQTLDDPLCTQKQIRIDVLRLDKIHTIISGNKWFKLKYYLQDAVLQEKKGIVSFGGAYSNHLVATAYSCKQAGLKSIGIIRGEEPATYSPALIDMQSYGMSLQFHSRQAYKHERLVEQIKNDLPEFLMVEEGGRGSFGIQGAEEILQLLALNNYTHLLCAVGTGTMMTGLINAAQPGQMVIGVLSLKLDYLRQTDILDFITRNSSSGNFLLLDRFHFGGYARKDNELLQFMNTLYLKHNVPTDFVYTGKLFFGVFKLIEENYFEAGGRILIIHSGGLQGNRSLVNGALHF
jgi:1-aminocyclopropane-1-carboxylate deaminase/D-cysteine desulfhydrase-like pyridoxal-dependent ACC family enzyme